MREHTVANLLFSMVLKFYDHKPDLSASSSGLAAVNACLSASIAQKNAGYSHLLPTSSWRPCSSSHHSLLLYYRHIHRLVHRSRKPRRHGAYSCLDVRGTRSAVSCEPYLHHPAWLSLIACIHHPIFQHSTLQRRAVPSQGHQL